MTTIAEYYKRVDEVWESAKPIARPEPIEVVRAARKLWRFGFGRTFIGTVEETSGRNYTWLHGGALMVNTTGRHHNVDRAWHDMIHDLSHLVHRHLSVEKPHSKPHARLELRMVREAIKRGYLTGTLKDKPRVAPPAPENPNLHYAQRKLASIVAAQKRWTTKIKRADTALRKLNRQHAYYTKRIASC